MRFPITGRTDGNYRDATLDSTTWAQTIIDYEHHEEHSGSAYFAVYSATAGNTDAIEVRIQTPNTEKWAHMQFTLDAGLAATAQLWVDTTKTDVVGNRITPMNRNMNSSNTSGLTICHTPAGSQAGNAGLLQYIGAATANGRFITGGGTGSRGEFILEQNTAYLLKMTSRANGNALSILMDWYEHTNKS